MTARPTARPIATPLARPIAGAGDGGGATPLLLDTYTGAAAAYSLRKLRTAYTGACIRVRRSSDNTEQDISFSGNELDSASLEAFCGSGSGFVVTWYDQSVNGRNATQATSTSQPRIFNAGVFDGRLVFDGSNDSLGIASWGTIAQPFTRNFVASIDTTGANTHLFNSFSGSPNSADYTVMPGQLSMFAGSATDTALVTNGQVTVITSVFNSTNSTQYKNGVSVGTRNVGTNGFAGVRIAAFSNSGQFTAMRILEVIIAAEVIPDVNRQAIETDQIARYLS